MVASFRTREGGFRYRISLPYRRSLFFTPNASENASRTPGDLFEHGTHIPYHRMPSPVPNATNGRKEKSIACSEYHKAKMRRAFACSECHSCQKRGVRCEKRSPPHRGKQKESDIKNRSLSNLGCDIVPFSNKFIEDLHKIWELRYFIPDTTNPYSAKI